MDAKNAIKKMAMMHNVSEQEAREEMQKFLELALNDPDPVVRAQWAAIPKKGDTLTAEDFIEYVAGRIRAQRREKSPFYVDSTYPEYSGPLKPFNA